MIGKGIYTRDVAFPGILYAKIFTAPYANAKIVSMDTTPAETLVGVGDILRYDNPDIAEDAVAFGDNAIQYSILTLPGIGDFCNHPMAAAVVADSEEICDRALRLIKIKWEERPFILDMGESLKPDAPKIMPASKRLNAAARELKQKILKRP